MPPSQAYEASQRSTSPKIPVAQVAVILPQCQAGKTVRTAKHGLIVVHLSSSLYHSHGMLISNVVNQVEPNRPFQILLSNVGSTEC